MPSGLCVKYVSIQGEIKYELYVRIEAFYAIQRISSVCVIEICAIPLRLQPCHLTSSP